MRQAFLSGRGGAAPHVHDRNRSQGLPSVVSDEGYRRLETTLNRRPPPRTAAQVTPATSMASFTRRFAAVADVEKAGFRRIAAGFYQEASTNRSAHSIWELRAAENEGEGYVLLRRQEERAVDLRQAGVGGGAGIGTAAAVGAGIVRTARVAHDANYPINPERDRRRAAPQHYLVSLLQVPGGDVSARKTIFSNEPMDLEALERLVGELKPGPMTVTHDTWTDGEWELRVRGPKGQLIHPYESVGPDEIGGGKGQALLDSLEAVIGGSMGGEGGEGGMVGGEGGMAGPVGGPPPVEMPPEAGLLEAPPAAGGAPAPGVLAPSAVALQRGARVLVVKKGQIAEAVVLMVNPHQEAVEVMFGSGDKETLPMHDVLDPSVDVEGHGGLELTDEAGGDGEDGLVEITADDLPDPFAVSVSEPSEEEPISFEGADDTYADGTSNDDYDDSDTNDGGTDEGTESKGELTFGDTQSW